MKYLSVSLTFFILFLFFSTPVLAIDFTIFDPNVSENKITFEASVSGLTSSSCTENKCYFQGGIQKDGGNFFGFTKNNSGDLIEYVSSPDPAFIKNKFLYCEPVDNACNFSVSMQFNHDDPKYDGPGEYKLKLKRYTGGSSGSTEKDAGPLDIQLSIETPQPTEKPTPEPTTEPTETPTPKPTKSPTPKPTASPKPSESPTASPSPVPEIGLATSTPAVLGTDSEESKNTSSKIPIPALLMIIGGVSSMGVAGVSIFRKRYNKDTSDFSPNE